VIVGLKARKRLNPVWPEEGGDAKTRTKQGECCYKSEVHDPLFARAPRAFLLRSRKYFIMV
jgi:hypothetical protein